jgi:hypothetical protein
LAEQQATQLDGLCEVVTDGLLVWDAAGTLVRTNATARNFLGLDAAPPGYAKLPRPERTAYYQVRDAQGRPLAPEQTPGARALRGEVLTGMDAMDVQVRTLDGREVD